MEPENIQKIISTIRRLGINLRELEAENKRLRKKIKEQQINNQY